MDNSSVPLLELRKITKLYESATQPILTDISISIGAGDRVALLGPSGSGKSTIFNIISGLDRPSSGSVLLDGKDIVALSDNAQADLRCKDIGFVFQLHHLLPQCTVIENITLPAMALDKSNTVVDCKERALWLLEKIGLARYKNHWPGQLSVGERQRIAIARAVINKPRLLLADEPTGSLDEDSAKGVIDLLVTLNAEEKIALIVATHSKELAARMSSVYTIKDRILEYYSPEKVFRI